MPGTPTTRHALPTIAGATDNVSTFPTVHNAAAASLDSSVYIYTGLLAVRSSVTPADGDEYHSIDTAQCFKWNATLSVWQTMLLAGAWTALTLGSNFTAVSGAYVPSYRLVGDNASLRGAVTMVSSSSGVVLIATLPAGFRPASTVYLPGAFSPSESGSPPYLTIAPSGAITWQGTLGTGFTMSLDGLTFPTS